MDITLRTGVCIINDGDEDDSQWIAKVGTIKSVFHSVHQRTSSCIASTDVDCRAFNNRYNRGKKLVECSYFYSREDFEIHRRHREHWSVFPPELPYSMQR